MQKSDLTFISVCACVCAYDVRVYELNSPVELYVYTVNSEIFAIILFALLKIRDWSMIYGKAARTSFFGQFGASGGGVFGKIILVTMTNYLKMLCIKGYHT